MRYSRNGRLGFAVLALLLVGLAALTLRAQRSAEEEGWRQYAGTIQAIAGDSITIKTGGINVTAVIQADSTRIFRAEKDRIGLAPANFRDLRIGDSVMAMGRVADTAGSISAFAIIVLGTEHDL